MTLRQRKAGYFVVEGLNAFATSFYFSYLFFLMQSRYGFGDLQNLGLSALNGLVYMLGAWYAGGFAQRRGYFTSVKLGIAVMTAMLLAGWQAGSAWGHIATMVGWTVGLCFTWPALEALASDGETPAGLQQMVGVYNLVWSAGAALAYFSGGAMLEWFGPQGLFLLPAGLHLIQMAVLAWLQRQAVALSPLPSAVCAPERVEAGPQPDRARPRLFLRLAWVANPFAYMAINTVLAVIPGLARRHDLTPMWAGFFCSIWFFARMGTFLALWLWTGWHYRFRWLTGGFVMLILSFGVMLLASELWLVCLAQLGFGIAAGLIYYSSLYYSMDAGDLKGQHGGFHEAAIGIGLFAGPALGASSLYLAPQRPFIGALTVGGLMVMGLMAFLGIRLRTRL